MSPLFTRGMLGLSRFPRVSGDEPTPDAQTAGVTPFSPRERG